MARLIYVMDPYCPWCFAGSKVVQRLYETYASKVTFQLLPASMLTHEYAFDYSPCMEAKQVASLAKIEQTTGTHFGEAYRQTLKTEAEPWNSTLACSALEAVRRTDEAQLFAYANALLEARFIDGRSLQDEALFLSLAERFGISASNFLSAYRSEEVAKAVEENFTLVDDYAEVYPTLCFDDGTKKVRIKEGHASYEEVAQRLDSLLAGEDVAPKTPKTRTGCAGDVCEI